MFITAFTWGPPTVPVFRIQRSCYCFVIRLRFYGDEMLAPRPTPKLVDYLLSVVVDCLFNIFAATFHIRRPFLHAQPEGAPCRSDRDPLITDREPLITVTGSHLSLWQGPTYHCDRDPLITVTGAHLSLWQGPTYHCDRDPIITVTGAHLSLWQGPTYQCDRDPLITVTGAHLSLWQGPTYHDFLFLIPYRYCLKKSKFQNRGVVRYCRVGKWRMP